MIGMPRVSETLSMPSGYFALVMRHLGVTPALAVALLEDTAILPDQLPALPAEISLGQGLQLLRNANQVLSPGWALDVGRLFQPSTHGPMGVAAISAPTLYEVLGIIQRGCHLRHPAYRAVVRQEHGQMRLEINECLALWDEERLPLIETFLLSFQALVEAVLGRPMSEGCFEMAVSPPSYAARYADYFHAPVRFGTSSSAIVVPAKWAEVRCPFADADLHEAALLQLEALSRRFDRHDYTAARVEHLMLVSGDSGLSLADAAKHMGLSERTLMRRLRGAEITFRDLRDRHRRRRAEELLSEGTLSMAELGYRLGYEDSSNFNRAFRRWFGQSPGLLRSKSAQAR